MTNSVQLSSSQQTAVDAPWQQNTTMIVSTAGSGKTLVLTRRVISIAKQLLQKNLLQKRLLCLCFNKSAALEMLDRITLAVQADNLINDIYVSPSNQTLNASILTIEVRTFHSLCYYILRSTSYAQRCLVHLKGGLITTVSPARQRQLVFHALKGTSRIGSTLTQKKASAAITTTINEIAAWKGPQFDKSCAEYLLKGTFSLEPPSREIDLYQQQLNSENAVDYADMICKAFLLFYHSPQLQDTFKAKYASVLVDEFQDMSATQLFLCRVLTEQSKSLTFVGDDDQQIYSFRTGTGWSCHQMICKLFPNVKIFTLPENRRCPGAVVEAARTLISNNTNRIEKHITAVRSRGCPVRIIGCKNSKYEEDFVLRAVRKILPMARQEGGRILLLFRTNADLLLFQHRFKRAGIATTRKHSMRRKTKHIGSRTLMIFALISLMSPKIDLETFVWAAMTISPTLEVGALEKIVKSMSGSKKSNTSSSSAGPNVKAEPRLMGVTPLSYLGQITEWFATCWDSDMCNQDSVAIPIHTLLKYTEKLALKIKDSERMEDVVMLSEEVLSSEVEPFEEGLPSQSSVFEEANQEWMAGDGEASNAEKAGYDVLLSTARNLDTVILNSTMDASKSCAGGISNEDKEGSDDDNDFAELFSQDRNSRAKKRRRTLGIKRLPDTKATGAKIREQVKANVEVLRKEISEKLMCVDEECFDSVPHSEGPIIVLSTVHSAKGTTFLYVFLCCADEKNFPHGGLEHTMDCGLPPIWDHSGAETAVCVLDDLSIQEERRAFFVALTRTFKQFTCTYSSSGIGAQLNSAQSPFIKELLQGLQWNPDFVVESFVREQKDIDNILSRAAKEEKKLAKEEKKPVTEVKRLST